ncbi:unnamed protein product [Rotaria sp. Silwood1]|nr:unnamed protein product [Rotaria sp. Silwood1]CAF0945305.1 unnamed protein product [Rotaria sp. Silwood1]CAF3375707.1 unnamed protein product [Rotaria sp. Silwood1]CAF3395518.1 unnamed protein product [Rotaria sp. Silwood1]CAF3398687.1 unnamed protein product [Rotaria sp. Silwood1]
MIIIIYILIQHVLNERQLCKLKYAFYVTIVMLFAIILPPIFFLRPRNPLNIRLASILLNPIFRLLGLKYRVENAQVLDDDKPCIIVANHQSSIDFIGMMYLWPKHIRYCTILAKKELLWLGPFGISSWLAGVEFIDRNNRQRASETMSHIMKKIQNKSLRLWVFPEGTRNMDETFLPFKFGAFRLAIQAQVPIVPIVFSPYKSIYNADKSNNSYYWRPGCITIKCLEPIGTTGMTVEHDLQRLTEMTRKRMLDEYLTIQTTLDEDKKGK